MLAEIFSNVGYLDSHLLGAKTKVEVGLNNFGEGLSSMFRSSSKSEGEKTEEEIKKEIEELEKKRAAELALEEKRFKEAEDLARRFGKKIFGPNYDPVIAAQVDQEQEPKLVRGVTYGVNPLLEVLAGQQQRPAEPSEAGSVPTPEQLDAALAKAATSAPVVETK